MPEALSVKARSNSALEDLSGNATKICRNAYNNWRYVERAPTETAVGISHIQQLARQLRLSRKIKVSDRAVVEVALRVHKLRRGREEQRRHYASNLQLILMHFVLHLYYYVVISGDPQGSETPGSEGRFAHDLSPGRED